jgi:hypothetical protein
MLVAASFPCVSAAQQQGQKTFASAEEASKSLAAAAKNNDEKAMLEILGPGGKEIVTSGDPTEDANHRAAFVRRYEQMHRLVKEPDGSTVLYVGAENWPAPIPLLNKGNVWYFDTETGKKEILYRRIGRNEMSAIRICEELVAAEKEYYSQHNEYAQTIFSDEGKHNGLYWKVSNGEPQSPIGPLVAAAVAEGYVKGQAGPPTPYHGYLFHVLTRGAKSYITDGKMTGGFAFVAYPADYRSSGVMTFIVNEDGVVYQKDLGKKTEELGKSMTEYKRNASWRKAREETQQTAAAHSQSPK